MPMARWVLPKDWVEDAERCRRAHIPEEARQLRSKCELALELVDSACQHGVRFGYVAVDGGYGKDPAFLRGLETRSLCFLADVHKHQRIWLDDPAPYRPATTSRGRPASIRRTDRPALTVAEWAAQQPVSAWKRIKLRQGEKGTLKAEYLHARVWAWDRKEETARHWHLLVRRECGADTPSHFVFAALAGGQHRAIDQPVEQSLRQVGVAVQQPPEGDQLVLVDPRAGGLEQAAQTRSRGLADPLADGASRSTTRAALSR